MSAIAIVGAGPRGVSLIERIAAHLPADNAALDIHLVDDAQHGAGRIWETDQTRTLCMNTLAGAVTLFTEPESTMTAPVLEGPTQYEWIQLLRGEEDGIKPEKVATYRAHPADPAVAEAFAEELKASKPESNPSRALYGAYIEWFMEVALAQLPENVTVHQHHSRAVGVHERGDHDVIELADGTEVRADATVLAYGWQVPGLTESEEHIAEAGLHWVRPDNPVEQPLADVPADQEVLVRGLGMGFFDVMALVTAGRGGRFVEDDSPAGLHYEASGKEPRLVVASGRGYPFIPKSEYHSLPPKAKLVRFNAALGQLGDEVDFGVDLLPAILRDAYAEYYETQARVEPEALQVPLEKIVERIDETVVDGADLKTMANQLRDALEDVSTEPLDLAHWSDPLADFDGEGSEELTAFIAKGLARDIREAVAAQDSPLKSALWAVASSRKQSSIAGSEGRMTWESRQVRTRQLMAFGQMVGSGPPLFRTRQLLALIEAGLVRFVGGRPRLGIGKQFELRGSAGEASSDWLVDAWMHQPDIRRAADPLAVSIADRVRSFVDHGNATGSPETTWERLVVRGDGDIDKRLHIVGIPTYAQWPDTTISPMPGTDPLMLQETDRTAGSLVRIALG
ncbi:FAD-NAD(P)-binding [Corynebacterium camporealensis]|uniref:FAD/NAD(P)-binding protein n=1 Tax=Corynebacterium camporealensis TaxID=161896 RepID=UPI000CFA74DA|nr:FAD/NAD(P)-binding protein [Corynebacterium camporealensis]AVH88872.1 FAD-NAD(P)-binding [Corynebacterium camporealensis]